LDLDKRDKLLLEARLLDPEKFNAKMDELGKIADNQSMTPEERQKLLSNAEAVLAAKIVLDKGDDDYAKLVLAERRMHFAADVYIGSVNKYLNLA